MCLILLSEPFKQVFHDMTAVMQQAQLHYLPKQYILKNQICRRSLALDIIISHM